MKKIMKVNRACWIAALIGVFALFGASALFSEIKYKRTCLRVGNQTVEVLIAKTPEELEMGLSAKPPLKDGEGMLFIFEKKSKPIFHRGKVKFPLSLAFINERGKILKLVNMESNKRDQVYEAPANTRYALEVPIGSFARNQIKEGSQIRGNRKILKDGQSCVKEKIA